LFTHGATRSSQELVQKCLCIPGSNWNLATLVFEERKIPEYPENTLLLRRANNKLKPHYEAGPGIEPIHAPLK